MNISQSKGECSEGEQLKESGVDKASKEEFLKQNGLLSKLTKHEKIYKEKSSNQSKEGFLDKSPMNLKDAQTVGLENNQP